ncbi:DUF1990 domain-containing protein [Nocardia huaxiensis]|uniref:DUF1990 domain-containing protein n=1 Tax=Nocardia huaxiensis TaxID=2755382 RepID=A0A7D6Z374_9NOCA|nr:DUF1990 domain-containing protein [Nocardia huaxiensis]QLY29844.1 DUF1990 domain-containing protein [Nocardia huaxiensis]
MPQEPTGAPFTYPDVGATKGEFPPGYHHFRRRRRIGSGREVFDKAADDILGYRMQKGTGIFHQADTPTATPGTEVRMFFGLGRLGITAPARVVYVLDEPNRRGFAYGTLPGHPLRGEEVFAVEYDPADESVHVVVAAFSLPGTWYSRLGNPVVRQIQRIFSARYLEAVRPPS